MAGRKKQIPSCFGEADWKKPKTVGRKLWIRRIADLIEAAEDGLLVGIQAAHELRVVQGFLAVFGSHTLQGMQTIGDGLLTVGRHLLPFRQQGVLHVVLLLGRHVVPGLRAIFHGIALGGREAIVVLQVLADLLLLFGRHALEPFVVLQEAVLLLGRHLAKFLRPLSGQSCGVGAGSVLHAISRGGGGRVHRIFVGSLAGTRVPCPTGGALILCGIGVRRRLKGTGRMSGIRRTSGLIRIVIRGCGVGPRLVARPILLRTRTVAVMRRRWRRSIAVLRADRLRGKPQQERERERRKYSVVLHFHFTRFQDAATMRAGTSRDFILG